mmetsp:Transcript_129285/g.374341  ORF Transcript_129285/g.374341 Transcript_129285/m.374341 type:complete len:223 (+) Transcript_129285:101-769(+)
MVSLYLACVVVLLFLSMGLLMWAWGGFLDRYEHDPERVRCAMFGILGAAGCIELGLFCLGTIRPFVLVVSAVANLWGGVDALLRYPAAHDVDSFFALKQFLLLVAKAFSYGFGMTAWRRSAPSFLVVLLLNICGLPVLYAMALPMDPTEQVAKDDAQDVDLVVRVWKLAVCPSQRRACLATCRGWWYRRLAVASESSSLARMAICAASPEYRRMFRKINRSV